jgi:MATE family multidrug resistance protein
VEALRRTATVLLRFVAAYNLLDAAQMIFVSALKGAGDTGFILRVSMVMATSLAIVSYASVSLWNLGLYGCWALIACWVWALGAVYYLRFQQGKWRKMRVTD